MSMNRSVLSKFSALFVALLLVTVALAHDVGLTGIRVELFKDHATITVTTAISRLIRAEGNGRTELSPVEIDLAIRKRLHLTLDGKPATFTKSTINGSQSTDLVTWQASTGAPAETAEATARLYPEDPGSKTAFTVVRDNQLVQESLLDETHPTSQKAFNAISVVEQYLFQGITHILSGYDHIAFVVGLLLLSGTLKSLLKTVTAFTLAHSITLSLAATGVLNISPRIIEPLIALSIVAIAIENLRTKNPDAPHSDPRPYFAFGFGLIHGFGFAGALSEVGIPSNALFPALASFNIGVELGQVAIVLIVCPAIALAAAKNPASLKWIGVVGSSTIGILGSYWFFSRLLGS